MAQFGSNLRQIPSRLRARAFKSKSIAELMTSEGRPAQGEMRKTLNGFDTILFGIGGIVGAGVFVITGVAARDYAGPAVMLSYVVSAISATLSALCYSEFAVEIPVAGGAFSYLMVTFGEYPAFITVSNLLLEYVFSSAAVARGFSSYMATLFNQHANKFRIAVGPGHDPWELDFVAVLIIVALTALLCYGTKESSKFNVVVTALNVLVVLFIVIAGISKGQMHNVTSNFSPYGVRGVFDAAALVFFSYIGFDSVATLAEEVKNPARDLPIGIIGSVVICMLLYVAMCLSLTLMVPYTAIDINAPFSVAFNMVAGWKWAKYFVSFGAVMGIITSLLVNLLGQSRVTLVMARSHLIPPSFAKVSESSGTPVMATIVLSGVAAVVAFFASLDQLANLVSIGTLFIFLTVASALIYKRYHTPGTTSPKPVLLHLLFIFLSSFGLSLFYQLRTHPVVPVIFGLLWFAATLSLQLRVPMGNIPKEFAVPFMPWLASFSMLLNVFLLSTLDKESYIRFFVWSVAATAVYVFYGVHACHDADPSLQRSSDVDAGGLNYVKMEKLPRESFNGRGEEDFTTIGQA